MARELDFNKLSPRQQLAIEYYFQLEGDPKLPYPDLWTVATTKSLFKQGWFIKLENHHSALSPAGRAAYLEAITPKGDNWL